MKKAITRARELCRPVNPILHCCCQSHILLKRKAKRAYYRLSIDYNFVLLFRGRSEETEKPDGQSAIGAIPAQRLNTGIALSPRCV